MFSRGPVGAVMAGAAGEIKSTTDSRAREILSGKGGELLPERYYEEVEKKLKGGGGVQKPVLSALREDRVQRYRRDIGRSLLEDRCSIEPVVDLVDFSGVWPVDQRDVRGRSALYYAAVWLTSREACSALLVRGANVNLSCRSRSLAVDLMAKWFGDEGGGEEGDGVGADEVMEGGELALALGIDVDHHTAGRVGGAVADLSKFALAQYMGTSAAASKGDDLEGRSVVGGGGGGEGIVEEREEEDGVEKKGAYYEYGLPRLVKYAVQRWGGASAAKAGALLRFLVEEAGLRLPELLETSKGGLPGGLPPIGKLRQWSLRMLVAALEAKDAATADFTLRHFHRVIDLDAPVGASGEPALVIACATLDGDAVRSLLTHGANPNAVVPETKRYAVEIAMSERDGATRSRIIRAFCEDDRRREMECRRRFGQVDVPTKKKKKKKKKKKLLDELTALIEAPARAEEEKRKKEEEEQRRKDEEAKRTPRHVQKARRRATTTDYVSRPLSSHPGRSRRRKRGEEEGRKRGGRRGGAKGRRSESREELYGRTPPTRSSTASSTILPYPESKTEAEHQLRVAGVRPPPLPRRLKFLVQPNLVLYPPGHPWLPMCSEEMEGATLLHLAARMLAKVMDPIRDESVPLLLARGGYVDVLDGHGMSPAEALREQMMVQRKEVGRMRAEREASLKEGLGSFLFQYDADRRDTVTKRELRKAEMPAKVLAAHGVQPAVASAWSWDVWLMLANQTIPYDDLTPPPPPTPPPKPVLIDPRDAMRNKGIDTLIAQSEAILRPLEHGRALDITARRAKTPSHRRAPTFTAMTSLDSIMASGKLKRRKFRAKTPS